MNWDESEHPRDYDGQFAEKAGAAATKAAGLPPSIIHWGVNFKTTGIWAITEEGRIYVDDSGWDAQHTHLARVAGLAGDGDFAVKGKYGVLNNGQSAVVFDSFKDFNRGAEDMFISKYTKLMDKLAMPADVVIYKNDSDAAIWKGS